MMFEVQDLAVASPATVSRCGMVYLEPSILKLSPFIESWLNQLCDNIFPYSSRLKQLCDTFLEVRSTEPSVVTCEIKLLLEIIVKLFHWIFNFTSNQRYYFSR